jgi:hypothetical protein
VEPPHVARLQAERAFLDRVLEPGETYLDLTGRQAQYFYLERRPAVEVGATYNLVAEAQQLRAIEALRRRPPPVVLVSADNILHDGGPASLRAPLVYRHVLLTPGFEVVSTDRLVWLVRADRVQRLAGAGAWRVAPIDDAPASPLHAVFRPPSLDSIPASWGRSAATLEGRMRLVRVLGEGRAGPPAGTVEAAAASPDPARARGSLRLDVSDGRLDGRDAGILSLDLRCPRAARLPPFVRVRWAGARHGESDVALLRFSAWEGHLMVPLDAAPAWLLARDLRSLRLELEDPNACTSFEVTNARLYQRHAAGADDPAERASAPLDTRGGRG